jgi:hypothetical protein
MPLLIKGGAKAWKKGFDWKLDAVAQRYGSFQVPLRDPEQLHLRGGHAPSIRTVNVRDYLKSIKKQYLPLFENKNMPLGEAMREELDPRKLAVADVRLFPIVSMGTKKTGIHFHQHDENWVAQLAGRKRWFLASPEDERPTKLPSPCDYSSGSPDGGQIARCDVNPGDVLYLPGRVWHATCNMDSWTFGFGSQGLVENRLNKAYMAIVDNDLTAFQSKLSAGKVPPTQPIIGNRMSMVELAAYTGRTKFLDVLDKMGMVNASEMPVWAINAGQIEVIKWFLAHGHSVDAFLQNGKTLLMAACMGGHNDILQWLLETAGANPALADSQGLTALHICAANGNVEALKTWMHGNHGMTDARTADGKTPLDLAVEFLSHDEDGTDLQLQSLMVEMKKILGGTSDAHGSGSEL